MSELVEVKQIGEVEHIVHASGQWDGTGPVEFSDDGQAWVRAWIPSDEHPHPEFARVEVYRKDVRIPTSVTIRWDEQFPAASEEWSGMWTRSPMRHFGRTARMVAFRQTFRDMLGGIVIPDEGDTRADAATTAADAAPARDWAAEIAAAESSTLLDAIEKDARAQRIFTPDKAGTDLHRALRARRREIESVDVESAWATPGMPDAEPVADAAPARPAPQDHLPPANRAARRAAARKKGGKR